MGHSEQERFLSLWDKWAKEEGLQGIYFVKTIGRHDADVRGSYSAVVTREPNYTFAHDEKFWEKVNRVLRSRVVSFINKKFLLSHKKGIVMTKSSYDLMWERILERKKSR